MFLPGICRERPHQDLPDGRGRGARAARHRPRRRRGRVRRPARPSGSGKSTLLNILGGLDTPTSGEAFYRDQDLTARRRARADPLPPRRHVGFVFQFYNLIPSLTARENVALVTEIADDPMTPEEALALSASRTASTTSRRSSPAASSSASRSRAPSPSAPTSCSATSRPARSTSPPASSCSRRSPASTASSGRPPDHHPQRRHRGDGRPRGDARRRPHRERRG